MLFNADVPCTRFSPRPLAFTQHTHAAVMSTCARCSSMRASIIAVRRPCTVASRPMILSFQQHQQPPARHATSMSKDYGLKIARLAFVSTPPTTAGLERSCRTGTYECTSGRNLYVPWKTPLYGQVVLTAQPPQLLARPSQAARNVLPAGWQHGPTPLPTGHSAIGCICHLCTYCTK